MQTHKLKPNSNLGIFTPNFKRKRISQFKALSNILPSSTLGKLISGLFTGFSVEVTHPEHIRELYDTGCFGKGSKSRSCPEFIKQKVSPDSHNHVLSESLLLGLEEAFFLAHFLKILQIHDISGTSMNSSQLLEKFSKVKPDFVENLVGYVYLRSKNWIVRSGTKFGANFLIYKKGPRFFHASFMVFVDIKKEELQPKDVKGIHRVAETSDKDVLLLEITRPTNSENILENLDKFTVSENIIKRFNYSAFVQSK